jgi:hypothetical protein
MKLLPLFLLAACDLTKLGVYGCEEYCDQLIDKAVTCASEEGISFDDLVGDSQETIDGECQVEVEQFDEAECQAQTALINNATCDQIVGLMSF